MSFFGPEISWEPRGLPFAYLVSFPQNVVLVEIWRFGDLDGYLSC